MLKPGINLTRLFKQTIIYVVLVSLQLGMVTQSTQAYAQSVLPIAQTAPFSGYNPDGTLYMGGQRIGNPHQVLHDAQIPAFMTITANRYTYSADPTHGQGTLAQMELATTNGSDSSVLLNRLYLSPTNPYVAVLTILSAVRGLEFWQQHKKNISSQVLEDDMVNHLLKGITK